MCVFVAPAVSGLPIPSDVSYFRAQGVINVKYSFFSLQENQFTSTSAFIAIVVVVVTAAAAVDSQ